MKYSLSAFLPSGVILSAALTAAALAVSAGSAQASNLVLNGDFEQLSAPGSSMEFGGRFSYQQVTAWTTDGYNFVFTPGSADTTGAVGEYGGIRLWGPNNGSANGLPATSPTGGNYLALDGAYAVGAVSQMIHGLEPGHQATVSFYYAGAQQYGYTGATTEQFEVSLGAETQFTPVLDDASHGFTGWTKETLSFVPTSTSEVLSFLAIGTPNGVPPFSLLDGVSVASAPEPATLGLMLVSFAGFGAWYRRSKRNAENRAAKQ